MRYSKSRALFIFLAAVPFVLSNGCSLLGRPDRVCFQRRCIDVQVARKEAELRQGLKNRTFLPEDEGMLFIFPETGRNDFWMQDTLIPLDIIWFDEKYDVVYIASSLPPCISSPCPTYGPGESSRYVLEISAGRAERLGIKIGDHAEHQKGRPARFPLAAR